MIINNYKVTMFSRVLDRLRHIINDGKLESRAENTVQWSEQIVVLTLTSSLLAVLAIYLENQFLLIGAMIVAPFIDPTISAVIFFLSKKYRNSGRALLKYAAISGLGFIVAVISFLLLEFAGREIGYSQFFVNLGVEYFLAAVLLGIVGSYLWVWKDTSNVGAGISIGISLVPPLVNSARGLVLLDLSVFLGSFTFFVFNTIGIMLGAYFVLHEKYHVKEV